MTRTKRECRDPSLAYPNYSYLNIGMVGDFRRGLGDTIVVKEAKYVVWAFGGHRQGSFGVKAGRDDRSLENDRANDASRHHRGKWIHAL